MADLQSIIEQAHSLGKAIADQPAVRAYLAARQAVGRDAEAQTLLRDYGGQVEHIQQLEAENRPIEVADKRKLADLQARLASHDSLKELLRYQADYLSLMDKVQRAMEEPLAGPASTAPQA